MNYCPIPKHRSYPAGGGRAIHQEIVGEHDAVDGGFHEILSILRELDMIDSGTTGQRSASISKPGKPQVDGFKN
jgi:hypothetical protein